MINSSISTTPQCSATPATSLSISPPESVPARTQVIRHEAQTKYGELAQTIAEAFPGVT